MTVDLSQLNDLQRSAVTSPLDKPVLVIAGAGSGKTTTLIRRIHWATEQGLDPARTISLTFGKAAADEIKIRLTESMGPRALTFNSSTLHAFGRKIIVDYAVQSGHRPPGSIDDKKAKQSSVSVLKRLMQRPDPIYYPEAINFTPALFDLSVLLADLARIQLAEVLPSHPALVAGPFEWTMKMYRAYTAYKKRRNLIDFNDMLVQPIAIFQADSGFLDSARQEYAYAFVDELQDTSAPQWEVMRLLWGGQPIFGVGDPRQAIYEWRDATPEQLLNFHQIWPDVLTYQLSINYRSTPQIITAATNLMKGTPEADASDPLVAHHPSGVEVQTVFSYEQEHEAHNVAVAVKAALEEGMDPREIAVLYRMNSQALWLETALEAHEVPYFVRGGRGAWSGFEVRGLLAPLRLAHDPHDSGAFEDLVDTIPYLGTEFKAAVSAEHHLDGPDLLDIALRTKKYLTGKSMNSSQLDSILRMVKRVRSYRGKTAKEVLDHHLPEYTTWLKRNVGSAEDDGQSKLDLLQGVIEAAAKFETVADFLDHATVMSTSGKKEEGVKAIMLSTIHRAKGLEWDMVFVVGVNEEILPHRFGVEREERRLAYVAFTRPRKLLVLSSVGEVARGDKSVKLDMSRYLWMIKGEGLVENVVTD